MRHKPRPPPPEGFEAEHNEHHEHEHEHVHFAREPGDPDMRRVGVAKPSSATTNGTSSHNPQRLYKRNRKPSGLLEAIFGRTDDAQLIGNLKRSTSTPPPRSSEDQNGLRM
jgi:hypothetical protein